MAVSEMVPLIFAGVNGHLDSVPVNKITQWGGGLPRPYQEQRVGNDEPDRQRGCA